MNAITQFNARIFAPKNSKINMEQRGFYFTVGFGIIIFAMATPPESMFWMAALNVVGIGLVILSILGKRLFSTQKESGFFLEPKQFSCVMTGLTGILVSVAAIGFPPSSPLLAFFVHLSGILLVTHAILDAESLLGRKPKAAIHRLPTNEGPASDSLTAPKKAA